MNTDPDAPGEGEEPYLTPVQANKIVASLLNPRKRFPFDAKVARFAIRQTIKNMKNADGRISNGAVANLIKMEKLNQNDDLARLATAMGVLTPKPSAQPINVGVTVGVQVVEADDWYGTGAATNRHLAAGNGASANGALESVAVQGGGVRPAVGQNGHRTNGHAEGPRELPGPAAGGD